MSAVPLPSGSLSEHLDRVLAAEGPGLVELRRDLHMHPELGRAERRTTSRVRARLEAAGLQPRVFPSQVGLYCDIGTGDGPLIALRADIDALPIPDEKDVPYKSAVPGVCHACGHDVHTAIVVGAGIALSSIAASLPGRVRLVFQPAEEANPGGAIDVIAAGGLDGVDRIFALHCDPRVDVGRLAVRPGPITAAADLLEVRLYGPGGHTARPHLTADLAYVLARVVTDLPAGLSRRIDPRAGLSLVWGMIAAGSAANVIPQSGVAKGTIRVLDREAWEAAPEVVERLLEACVAPYGVTAELDYARGVPPVVNEEVSTAMLVTAGQAALGPSEVESTTQSLGGEDFAWYLEHVPGALARIGVRRPNSIGRPVDLHSGLFDADERAIDAGVRVLVHAAFTAMTDSGGR